MNESMPESFQRLFREHYPTVARKLHALVSDRSLAEDLAQEVFVRLYRSPPDDLSRIGPWLQRVLTRIAYDHLRKRTSERRIFEREHLRLETETHAVPSNETIAINNWEKDVVRQVLQKLSERDRTALLLKEQGYSYAEIGERLNVNPKIVGSLLSRAAERFKKRFGEEEAIQHEG